MDRNKLKKHGSSIIVIVEVEGIWAYRGYRVSEHIFGVIRLGSRAVLNQPRIDNGNIAVPPADLGSPKYLQIDLPEK